MALRDPQSGRRSGQAGFTLTEVLAAMLIMAVTIPVLVQGALLANRVGVLAERERTAAMLGDSLLTEAVVTESWRDGVQSGDFGHTHAAYGWRLVNESWDADTMRQVSVEVSFEVQGRPYTVLLSTLVPEEGSSSTSTDTEQATAESGGAP